MNSNKPPPREATLSAPAIGVDSGTTKTVMAQFYSGQFHPVVDSHGRDHVPSVVGRSASGALAVGWDAVNHRDRFVQQMKTVASVKRAIARREPGPILGEPPRRLVALVLAAARKEAQRSLGRTVTEAVVATPASFDVVQRGVIRAAAAAAGWKVLRLLNEPTAAALAFFHLNPKRIGTAAIIDLGGGTLDVSVVMLEDGICEVMGTAGDALLGGEDFNERVMDLVRPLAPEDFWSSDAFTPIHRAWLQNAVEQAKVDLSTATRTTLRVPGFFVANPQAVTPDLVAVISREDFEQASYPLVARVASTVSLAMSRAGVERVDNTVLVGGASNMPSIKRMIDELHVLPRPMKGMDPRLCVAQGASLWSAVLQGRCSGYLLLDCTNATLSVGTADNTCTVMLPCNTTIPTKKRERFTTVSDNQTRIDIIVYEGESPRASENSALGKLSLMGLPRAAAGAVSVDVDFAIDASGIMTATATHVGTGQAISARLDEGTGLPEAALEAEREWVGRMLG